MSDINLTPSSISDAVIEAGFETDTPTPDQSQRISELRSILLAVTLQVRDRCPDGPWLARTLKSLQLSFIQARASVLNDGPVKP